MEEVGNEKREYVRIIIGCAEKGKSGIKKPTKSITLINTTVEEVYNKIKEMLRKEK